MNCKNKLSGSKFKIFGTVETFIGDFSKIASI
jgi:hypothetical protein